MTPRTTDVVINESVNAGFSPARFCFPPLVALDQEVRPDCYCNPEDAYQK